MEAFDEWLEKQYESDGGFFRGRAHANARKAFEAGQQAERKRCAEIARNTVDHLASPLAPYNHGVMDAQTAIVAAIMGGE